MGDGGEGGSRGGERRRWPRATGRPRDLVAVSGEAEGLPYHLVDIGVGGMAFQYVGEAPLPLAGFRMDVYEERTLRVGRLPVEVVADRARVGGVLPLRRCSVRFGALTEAQRRQLGAFLGPRAATP